ncbi:hypothetical protein [Albibacterium bauzanense]|uniref:Uncharacterized protein n=1 Tax=Albibacterium bauzanense TaxID=653929 RepID=A0A4R1M023_9SPHI|nr:hypothetical protein [Albibacterium bauzanense]TCK84955.1 hypothetical protein C8N28_0251 [Albibacterium bauzanense]
MENKINLFSEYSYSESTLNIELKENAIIIQKVQTVKKKLVALLEKAAIDSDLFRILSYYFNLNNERPQEVPSERNIMYLRIISYRLIKVLKIESSVPKEQLLLRFFILINFNKDQIIEYYINKIDSEIENNPDSKDDILNCYWIESHYLPKKDIIYTSANHCLGTTINNHISILKCQSKRENEQAMQSVHTGYRHIPRIINLIGTSAVMMYAFNMLINTNIIKLHIPFKSFFEVISELVRRADGKKFSTNTLKSRFNTYSLITLYKMADLLEILREYNDYQIKMYHKRK